MLGFAHPNNLLDNLTSSQISEWQAYDRIEPIDMEKFGWAILCSVVSNIAISVYGKKGAKYTKPADFIPQYNLSEDKSEEQTVEEQKEILMRMVSLQKGKRK